MEITEEVTLIMLKVARPHASSVFASIEKRRALFDSIGGSVVS